MKKKFLFTAISLFIVALSIAIIFTGKIQTSKTKKDEITYKVIPTNKNDWGYEIFVNNSLFIRQLYVPCINEYKAFKSKREAESLARLVMIKIVENKSPTVTKDDLVYLGIIER